MANSQSALTLSEPQRSARTKLSTFQTFCFRKERAFREDKDVGEETPKRFHEPIMVKDAWYLRIMGIGASTNVKEIRIDQKDAKWER